MSHVNEFESQGTSPPTWRKCDHPRVPENTCRVSAMVPTGQCRICRLARMAARRRQQGMVPRSEYVAWNKGLTMPPLSPEARAKISAAQIGRLISPETRAKISKAQKGRAFTATHYAAVVAANRRPEQRAAISAALKGREGHSRHGHARKLTGHTPTYRTWTHMLQRCSDPQCDSYRYYGGRGITVCERWRTFENFLADMGERPPGTSIDRINNEGNYEPGNCRWATSKEQRANRRKKSNPQPVDTAA